MTYELYRFNIWSQGDGKPCTLACDAHSAPLLKAKFCIMEWFFGIKSRIVCRHLLQ